jgi:Ca-activated chloride channel family protein
MKSRIILLGLWLGAIAMLPHLDAQNAKDKKEPEKTDITEQVRAVNSDKYAAPPTEFRTGHVNPKAIDAKAITQTETGFTIKLPSGAPIPTPTVYKGKLYVSGGFSTKEYFCFDAISGKFEWGMSLDDDGPTSAVVEDDTVVFNTESCTIFALDAKTGKHLWSYFLGDPLTSTPTIANGKVYTSYPAMGGGGAAPKKGPAPAQGKPRPAASHVMICLELKTGKILWQKWIDSDVMSAPVAVDDEVYATTFAGTVYKFKQKDGVILSAHRSRATSAPIIVGNNIYMTQRADNGKDEKCAEEIACLDRPSQSQTFSAAKREAQYLDEKVQRGADLSKAAMKLDAGNGFGAGAPAAANPTAAKGNIGQSNVSTMQAFQGSRILNFDGCNFNCMGDELINTDPKDGKVRWKVKLKGDLAKQGGHLAAPPAAAGGQLFLTTLEGEVLQVDPVKGGVTKTYKVGSPIRSQAAIDGGRIYVGTQDGRLVCIDTGDARFTGWVTWGANMAHTNSVESPKK